GLSIQHAGECFQHANTMVSKYFKKILIALSSPLFYMTYVHLLSADELTPAIVYNNPWFYLFFGHAIGAVDSSHIAAAPPSDKCNASRNRKGGVGVWVIVSIIRTS
ncbi:uncharacterized protein C8Q71DRAFT_713217, partial [Rhodofomes roseus]